MPAHPKREKTSFGAGNFQGLEKERRKLLVPGEEACVYFRPEEKKKHFGIRGEIVRVQEPPPRKAWDPHVFFYATRILRILKPQILTPYVTTARRHFYPKSASGKGKTLLPKKSEIYSRLMPLDPGYLKQLGNFYRNKPHRMVFSAEQEKNISEQCGEANSVGFFLDAHSANTGITQDGRICFFELQILNAGQVQEAIRELPTRTANEKQMKKRAGKYLERWKKAMEHLATG